jgi:hypothetical protein
MPQKRPITALNVNYTILTLGVLILVTALSWFFEGRSSYSRPLDTEYVASTTTVIETLQSMHAQSYLTRLTLGG